MRVAGSAVERPAAPEGARQGRSRRSREAAGPSPPAGRSPLSGRCGVSPLEGGRPRQWARPQGKAFPSLMS